VSHYEERLERDLAKIRDRIADVTHRVEEGVKNALQATLTLDRKLANITILGDRAINREIRQIDHMCHAFVVRHLPSAGPLRFVSAALRLSVALERTGDYAVTVCREVVQLRSPVAGTVLRDIELIGHQAQNVFHQATKAFQDENADQARSVHSMATQVEDTFRKVYEDLLMTAEQDGHSPKQLFSLLTILQSLKRVSDQADNICLLTLFTALGHTKDRKVFRILFVDERNACLSQMAEGYARKAFPENGVYESAGWAPAERVDPAIVEFMDRQQVDVRAQKPDLVSPLTEDHRHYHIIISLQGKAKPFLEEVPHRTVLLEWDVGTCPENLEDEGAEAQLEDCYRRIAHEIRELMEMLEGPDVE
jgi:phosphate uptake regulator